VRIASWVVDAEVWVIITQPRTSDWPTGHGRTLRPLWNLCSSLFFGLLSNTYTNFRNHGELMEPLESVQWFTNPSLGNTLIGHSHALPWQIEELWGTRAPSLGVPKTPCRHPYSRLRPKRKPSRILQALPNEWVIFLLPWEKPRIWAYPFRTVRAETTNQMLTLPPWASITSCSSKRQPPSPGRHGWRSWINDLETKIRLLQPIAACS
jgi:hypothetical protein